MRPRADSTAAHSTWPLHMLAYAAPPADESLAEWAERTLVLGARQPTAFPGPFRLSTSPYLRGIMDALDDPRVHTVVVMAGAQTGKTTCAFAWLAHAVAADPGPCLVVYPTEDLARSVSATRIQPLFEDSPALAPLLPVDRRADWTLLQYRINGTTVNLVGSNSPANVASRPVRYVLMDETDKYPPEAVRGEADIESLVRQRTKTFWNRKILEISTPTSPEGLIYRAFLRGDQREYEAACPRCGQWQRLVWESIRWPEGRPSEAAFACASCGARWSEHERRVAIAGGRWTPTRADGERGVASFKLPSFLALWVTPDSLAEKWERVRKDPLARQDFINSDLARPYFRVDTRVTDERLRDREGEYDHGTLRWPGEPDAAPVFGGMDVQKDYFVLVLRQFRRDTGESAQVWHGVIRTFGELDELMTRFGVESVCVDCRYRSGEVYAAALSYDGIWPTEGQWRRNWSAVFELQTRDANSGSRVRGSTAQWVSVLVANSNALLDMLSDGVNGEPSAPRWWIPRGCASDRDYAQQMTAMYRANGAWVNPRGLPEHYMDAEKLSILAAWYSDIRPGVAAVYGEAAASQTQGDNNDDQ